MRYKICHIGIRFFPYIGGSTLRISKILQYLQGYSQELEISLITDEEDDIDLPTNIYFGTKIIRYSGYFKNFFKILKYIKNEKFDIIHFHNPRLAFFMSFFLKNKKIITEMHGLHEQKKIKRYLVKYALKKSNIVIVLSNNAKLYLENELNISKEKIHVLINGYDKKSNVASLKNKESQTSLVLGYIGTLYKWQGINLTVDAMNTDIIKSRKIKLEIFGDGPEYNSISTIIKENRLTNITLHGSVNPSKISDVMKLVDVIVMPRPSSLTTEITIPLKIFEAMEYSKAIIASNVGGFSEVVQNDDSAILITPSSLESLIDAILFFYNDRQQVDIFGLRAHKSLEHWATWMETSKKLREIYSITMEVHCPIKCSKIE